MRLDLPEAVTFEDRTYGPGQNIEVPDHFPLADDKAENAPTPARIFSKPVASPPNTGGVNTGENKPRAAESTASPNATTTATPAAPSSFSTSGMGSGTVEES